MAVNNITQTISTIPPAGKRGVDVQTIFVNKQEAFQDALTDVFVGQINTLRTQLNTFVGQVNTTATQVNTDATSASTSATTATTKASEASISASQALASRNQAETFAQQAQASASSVDANNIVHRTGDENVDGVKTFVKSPIVPTPTAGTQVANKEYVDTKVSKTSVSSNSVLVNDGAGGIKNSGVIIDDNGNVGVGTNSPSSSLTLKDGLTLISQFDNNTPRPAITNGVQKYGVHIGDKLKDDGFLRLSAGGGANPYAKSYIDLSGYSVIPDMLMNIVFGTAGAEKVRIDAYGNLLLTSGTGALGYGAGAGGTVTQLTSKNTGVTLNKPTGTIVMHNGTLAAGASAVFNFTNSLMTEFNSIKFQIVSGYLTYDAYRIYSDITNGTVVRVVLTNISAVSLSDSLILNYTIIKGNNN